MSELPIGTRIGNYEIVGELGRGGMGVVYRATEVALRRDVALKVLASHRSADSDFLARFLQEARAIAQLNHPNVVTIYQIGERGGSPFIAMEFLKGQELDRLLAVRGCLGLGEALSIARQIASALAAAHELGIIHRDIKPQNVMIDARGHVKVMDFGIAKLGASISTVTTSEGQLLGTPTYMAPEQFQFDEVDGRADLYSLGVLLYRCLSGRVPFDGESPMVVMYRALNEDYPPLSDAFPSGVVDLINRALSRDPDHRFQTGEQFLDALDSLRLTAPTRPAPAPSSFDDSAEVQLGSPPASDDRETVVMDRVELAGPDTTTRVLTLSELGGRFWRLPTGVRYGIASALGLLMFLLMASAFRGGGDEPATAENAEIVALEPVVEALNNEPAGDTVELIELTRESLSRAVGLFSGAGGYVDQNKARSMFAQFGESDDPLGRMWYAWLLAGGRCGFPADAPRAGEIAAASLPEIERLAREGDAGARFLLGASRVEGIGADADPKAGMDWMRRAAESTHPVAMNYLGTMYQDGVGTVANAGLALLWFQRAAAAGSVDAMNHLGDLYLANEDVDRAEEMAFGWFHRSAGMGSPEGMTRLGDLLQQGRGAEPDAAGARRWYEEAARLGDPTAQSRLETQAPAS